MRERKNCGLYLKETFKFREGDDYFGLVVPDVLFFKMNRATWEILDVFPDIDGLLEGEDGEEYREAVDSLRINGLISSEPFPEDDIDSVPGKSRDGLATLGLCLLQKEKSGNTRKMSTQVIHRAIDFLLDRAAERHDLTLLFISDNVPASLEAMEAAVSYASAMGKEHEKTIHFSLSTSGSHLSPHCTWFLRDHGVAVEFVIRPEEVESGLSGLSAAAQDQMEVVTLKAEGSSAEDIERAIEKLHHVGLNHVYLDTHCPYCQDRGEPVKGAGMPGLINLIPVIYSVMTSGKIESGCRAGIDYAAVTPEGEIYACHRNLHQRFRLGSLSEGVSGDLTALPRERREECRRCGIRYFCQKDYCREKRLLVQQSLAAYHRMNPREKRSALNIYRRMAAAMPFRLPAPEEAEAEKISRQLTVAGSSMKPLLKEGDIVMVEPPADGALHWGDIICFGKPATCHRLIWKSQRKDRTYVIEKGDSRVSGNRIPIDNISGKVVAVRKHRRILNLDKVSWALFNRLMALASLLVFGGGKLFNLMRNTKIRKARKSRR